MSVPGPRTTPWPRRRATGRAARGCWATRVITPYTARSRIRLPVAGMVRSHERRVHAFGSLAEVRRAVPIPVSEGHLHLFASLGRPGHAPFECVARDPSTVVAVDLGEARLHVLIGVVEFRERGAEPPVERAGDRPEVRRDFVEVGYDEPASARGQRLVEPKIAAQRLPRPD